MSQLLDELLLDKADFLEYRDISKNIDDVRLNSFIREMQIRELRTFLGEELYLLLVEDYDPILKVFATQRFTDLWYGIDYDDIRFNGLIGAGIMWSYKRMLNHQQMSITRYGIKNMTTEFSEDTLAPKIKSEMIDSDAMAKVYQSDANKFLRANLSDYPEWTYSQETKIKNTGFNFIKL